MGHLEISFFLLAQSANFSHLLQAEGAGKEYVCSVCKYRFLQKKSWNHCLIFPLLTLAFRTPGLSRNPGNLIMGGGWWHFLGRDFVSVTLVLKESCLACCYCGWGCLPPPTSWLGFTRPSCTVLLNPRNFFWTIQGIFLKVVDPGGGRRLVGAHPLSPGGWGLGPIG